jgi:hypothetical protein
LLCITSNLNEKIIIGNPEGETGGIVAIAMALALI